MDVMFLRIRQISASWMVYFYPYRQCTAVYVIDAFHASVHIDDTL